MKVEIREVAPDGADGDHAIVDARGRILVLRLPECASPEDHRLAAEDLQGHLVPGDIGFVLPPGYTLEVYRVVDATPDTTTPTPDSETATSPTTTP